MFYFLEGAGTAPYCRACLARHPKTTALDPDAAREVISWDRVDAPTGRFPDDDSEDHEHLASAVRSFLGEELDRLERALDRVSYDDPDLPLARSLHQEVQHQLFSGGLPEALLMLRDLRHILTGLERTRKRAPLHAPWDEGVVELFDRVRARASAMTPPAAPTPDGEDGDGPAVLRGPRSPATLGSAGKCAAAQTRP